MKPSAMSLGTVQLGMNYGIANNAGKPSEETAFAILRTALEKGVTSLDTARGYGDSEDVIGRFLKTWEGSKPFITTKILDLQGDTPAERERFAARSVETSLEKLGVSNVHAVPGWRRLRAIAEDLGLTGAQLAIAFMRDCGGVTSLVLGADNACQVASNASYFDTPTLAAEVVDTLKKDFAHVDIPAVMQVLSRPKK